MRSCLSKSELKVSAVLLSNYPVAGLSNIAMIAREAGVSEPTVSRLVAKLGFDSFASFRATLTRELQERLMPPTKIESRSGESSSMTTMAGSLTSEIMKSVLAIDRDDLDEAVKQLCNLDKTIFITGGRFSSVIAEYLSWSLQVLRRGIRYVGQAPGERHNALLDVSDSDVIVVFDFRRYQSDTVNFAHRAHQLGAKVIVFTDPYMSPAASFGSVVFYPSIVGPSQFNSLTPAMAILECLVSMIADVLGEDAQARIKAYVGNTETSLQ